MVRTKPGRAREGRYEARYDLEDCSHVFRRYYERSLAD